MYHRDHGVHWQRKNHPSTLSIRKAAKAHGGRRRCKHTLAPRLILVDEKLTYLEQSHTEADKAQMASGTALTDNDRWDFLTTVREKAVEALQQDNHTSPAVFVAVSVQEKKKYRDVLRVARLEEEALKMTFVHLRVGEDVVIQRIRTSGIPAPPVEEDDVVIINGEPTIKVITEEVVATLKGRGGLPRGEVDSP
ncbi:MAG: hypothetical protein Q9191_001289 [Dirinaria sp. TL-2023a]